jgi:EpsI family protein
MKRINVKISVKHSVVGLVMLAAAGLAIAMKPSERMAEQRPALNLEAAVPQNFGGWRVDNTTAPVIVSPDVKAALDKIYSQTLARTYIDSEGRRVMLTIAYGGDQSRETQVHKPEVCYPMQGFQITSIATGVLDAMKQQIPIMRLVAVQGRRVEPITYWIAVGDTVVRGAMEQNLARLKYGLTGTVPDGILVRVSSITKDERSAYELQDRFVNDMLQAMPPREAARLLGKWTG